MQKQHSKNIFQKSIVATVSIQLGTVISLSHLAFKKPGDGIPAGDYKKILGKKVKRQTGKDHKFTWEDFQ